MTTVPPAPPPPQAPPPAAPTPATLPPGKKPLVWPWIVMLVVGVVVGVAGIASVVNSVVDGVHDVADSPIYLAPATIAVDGTVGDYYVYQREPLSGAVTTLGSSSSSLLFTLRPDQVHVTGPSGQAVGTWAGSGAETVTRGDVLYSNAVGFHVSVAGTYTVRIDAVAPASVFVAPSIGTLIERAADRFILVGLGAILALVGLVLLIIALVRRSTYNKRSAYAGYTGPVPPYGGPAAPAQWIQPQSYAPQGYPPQPYYQPQGPPPQPGAGAPPGQWTPPPGTVPPQPVPPQPVPPQPAPPPQPQMPQPPQQPPPEQPR